MFDESVVRPLRESDDFEQLIHLQHIPINKEDPNDFIKIFNEFQNQEIALLSCYGIPICHKYIQKKKRLSFDDAGEKVRDVIVEKLIRKHHGNRQVVEKVLVEIAKSSLMWGPYTDYETRQGLF